jgi:multiple sugar transport system permease protein/putative aldouronate transport system permease protein
MITDPEMAEAMLGLQEVLKYAIIVLSTAPLMCFYPFAQRHFVKGVMIGSLKG